MCEKVKAKQISPALVREGRIAAGSLRHRESAGVLFLHPREVAGEERGGCSGSSGSMSVVPHDMHIPRSPVHSNVGAGLVPWILTTAQILQAHLKHSFCVSQGAGHHTKCACTFIMDLNACCTCAYLMLTRPLREMAKSRWWRASETCCSRLWRGGGRRRGCGAGSPRPGAARPWAQGSCEPPRCEGGKPSPKRDTGEKAVFSHSCFCGWPRGMALND